MARHPIQPTEMDKHGVLRFKRNAIVDYLLEAGPFDLNILADKDFSREDWEQFAQLIGYSLSGFGELSYVSTDTYDAAVQMAEDHTSEAEARINTLEATLELVRAGLREAAVAAFQIHPDDLRS
jgi:hypothetical protein